MKAKLILFILERIFKMEMFLCTKPGGSYNHCFSFGPQLTGEVTITKVEEKL